MDKSNQEKIFKLMCSDCWQVGVELFKANDLDLYEFIDYAIHRSNYTERIIKQKDVIIIYDGLINILGEPFRASIHLDRAMPYINVIFHGWCIYHSGKNNKTDLEKQHGLISQIYDKIKPIIYDD